MKLVFLILEYVPHQIYIIQEVLTKPDVEVLAYSVNDKYNISNCFNERFRNKLMKNFSVAEMLVEISSFNPNAVVVGGWAYKKYNKVSCVLKKRMNIPIISYSDTQWRGDWTQIINSLISPFYLKRIYTHLWVSGVYQYEYARKLGFKKSEIIFNALSCQVKLFENLSLQRKQSEYPKNFIYVGRFVPEKGLNYLLDAWKRIDEKKGWTLTLIGEGPLKDDYLKEKNIIVKNFMPHDEVLKEMSKSGCFILPSIYEPWALVIHEAAAAGLPIICTEVCGAAPHFVIDYYNGFKVKPKDADDLKIAMENIISLELNEILLYSKNSRQLSKNITPSIGAASLMALIS